MSKTFTDKQRAVMYEEKGKPILILDFDIFLDGQVAMWTHTKHGIPFPQMKAAFQAAVDHLTSFISNESMCPFYP